MNSKEKPTLGGTRIKTRKRNIAVPLDTATFGDAVVQIYLEHHGDLELIAKDIDAADLDFSRYGDTFFEVVFTGGPNQPGTTKPEEGAQQPYSVLNCESTRQSILPYVLFLQKIIRRRPFMIKTLENVMRRLLQSLVSFYRFKGFSIRSRFTFEFCFWNLLSCDYTSFFSPLWY
jgi:hypothetical protein